MLSQNGTIVTIVDFIRMSSYLCLILACHFCYSEISESYLKINFIVKDREAEFTEMRGFILKEGMSDE